MGRRLLVTVHGIRTFGGWQERLETMMTGACGDQLTVINYKYGYFSVVAFLFPFMRYFVVRKFQRYCAQSCRENSWERVDIVAHSFGTHVAAWALYRERKNPSIKIDTLILCGSVLKSFFPWEELLGRNIKRVVNECGVKDSVLLLSQCFVLFTGMSGRIGFSGPTSRDFRNRYFFFGHSGYFLEWRGSIDNFMHSQWMPLLLASGDIPQVDERMASPLGGVKLTIINNLDLAKLVFYITPLLLLLVYILSLYFDARHQRDDALVNESRVISGRSLDALNAGKTDAALVTALDAQPVVRTRPRVREGDGALTATLDASLESSLLLLDNARFRWATLNSAGELVTASSDAIRRWDGLSGVPIAQPFKFDSNSFVTAGVRSVDPSLSIENGGGDNVEFALNGDRALTLSSAFKKKVVLWDTTTGKPLRSLSGREYLSSKFSPDGSRLIASEGKKVSLWASSSGELVASLGPFSEDVDTVTFSREGGLFVVATSHTAQGYTAFNGSEVGHAFRSDAGIIGIELDPVPSARRAAVIVDTSFIVFDFSSGQMRRQGTNGSHLEQIRFDPAGTHLVTMDQDGGTASIWDAKTLRPTGAVIRDRTMTNVAFDDSGDGLTKSDRNGHTRQWDLQGAITSLVDVTDPEPETKPALCIICHFWVVCSGIPAVYHPSC